MERKVTIKNKYCTYGIMLTAEEILELKRESKETAEEARQWFQRGVSKPQIIRSGELTEQDLADIKDTKVPDPKSRR